MPPTKRNHFHHFHFSFSFSLSRRTERSPGELTFSELILSKLSLSESSLSEPALSKLLANPTPGLSLSEVKTKRTKK